MGYHRGHRMIDPYMLFRKGQVQSRMHVADFGCGRTGHIVFPMAEIVGEEGIVYAVDIIKDVLKVVRKRAKINNKENIHTVWADLEQVGYTSIPEDSVHVGYLVNTLFQSQDKTSVIKEVSRLLKEKSRLIVVDWKQKDISFGPDNKNYINFERVQELATEEDYTLQEEFEVGDYHHGLVFFRHE